MSSSAPPADTAIIPIALQANAFHLFVPPEGPAPDPVFLPAGRMRFLCGIPATNIAIVTDDFVLLLVSPWLPPTLTFTLLVDKSMFSCMTRRTHRSQTCAHAGMDPQPNCTICPHQGETHCVCTSSLCNALGLLSFGLQCPTPQVVHISSFYAHTSPQFNEYR